MTRQQRRAQERAEAKSQKNISTRPGAQALGLEAYHKTLGYVPALIETLEGDYGPQFEKMFFGEDDNQERQNFWNPNTWTDVVVAGVGVRVRKGCTTIQAYRPAYNDRVSLTAFEEGVARAYVIWNHLTNYTAQRGPVKHLLSVITHEQAYKNFIALRTYALRHLQDGNFFRFIDWYTCEGGYTTEAKNASTVMRRLVRREKKFLESRSES